MKGVMRLVVSLRGVNFRFWSRLGCSGLNTITKANRSLTIIFTRKGLFLGCLRRNIKKSYIFSIRFIYSIHVIKV